ncbi:MAG: UbiA family prenyltransferase [bacterium]
MSTGSPVRGVARPSAPPSRLRALALSCHPVPTAAVTALSAGLCALAGVPLARSVVVVVAVFLGQLSIGWDNDYLDRERDRAVARTDKPVAAGALPAAVVGTASRAALVLAVVASLALGLRPGAAALVIVAAGWSYNAGLKATAWSWLPYAIAFGSLPAVATLAASPSRFAAPWAVAAGACLGVAAHLANVLPDLLADAATGVRGLPHRLGPRGTAVLGAGLLTAASAVVLFGSELGTVAVRWVLLAAATAVAAAGALAARRRPDSPLYFRAIIVLALADLVLFATSGASLT